MQICQDHWQQLRKAIDDLGLTKFISSDGGKARERVIAQLEGNDGNEVYDPLLAANFAIWNNALHSFGLSAMAPDAPCPLCLLDKVAENGCGDPTCTRKHNSGTDWINYAANEQYEEAVKRKLLPMVQ